MGYTHYYLRPKKLDKAKFKLAVDDCKRIYDVLPIPLAGADGTGEPVFSDDLIEFNGSLDSQSFCKIDAGIPWPDGDAEGVSIAGSDEQISGLWCAGGLLKSRRVKANGDGSCEPLRIERALKPQDEQEEDGKYFRFCKTAFRPYDLNVQCCLIIFKYYFGDNIEVSTDSIDEQWHEARDICQHVLGYGMDFELDKK